MKISGFLPELVGKNARRRNRKNVYAQVPVEKYEAKQLMAGVVATAAEVVGTDGQDAQQQAPVSLDVVIKDANGNPTSQIDPGDDFLVEVSARDNRENAQGVFAVYTDVKFDTSLIDVLSVETAPGISNPGTIKEADGLVDDVSQLFFSVSASGPVSPLLFTLRGRATGEGTLAIQTAQAAIGGHQQVALFGLDDDLREQTEYGSATVQIGAPKLTLQQAPSINEDGQSLDVVVNYAGAGVDASDFNGATVKAVRKSDGATLNAQLVDVEPLPVAAVVGQQPAFGLKFKLDSPAGGFDFADNGTWDLLPTNFPGDVDGTKSLGTFEIDLEAPPAPKFETGIRFTDQAGNTLSIIEPDQQFRIEVSAKDLRDLDDAKLLGLLSAAYDIEFDTDLIDIVSIDQKYEFAPSGVVFEGDGLVDRAGGFFGVQAPGTSDAVDVVELVAVARKSGTLNITATPDESLFAAFQEGSRVALNVRDNVPSGTASIVIAAPLELSVSQPTLSENGGTATLTVTRGGSNISQDVRVDLTSNDTSELTVPEFVIIKAGETSVEVIIEGVDDKLLDGTQNVVVSGVATGFTEGTVNVDVTDQEVITTSINPDQVREDGGSFTLTITRSDVDDPSQPVVVKLSVPPEFQGQLDLPETAIIAAGEESVDVTVTAIDNAVEDGDRTFTITAEAVGFENGSDSVTIIDVEHSDVIVSKFDALNDRIDGGTEVRLTVTNNGTGTAKNFNVAIIHSDDEQIGNSDDQTRVTLTVEKLAPGESVELTTTVDFDVATLVERFIAENRGNPGEVAKSKMVDHLGAVADSSNVLEERNADGTAETNNSGNGQGKDMDDVTALPFDLDGDNVIAALDGLAAINNIGQLTTPETAAQDTNNNGFIDPLDAATYIGHIGISLNNDVEDDEITTPPQETSLTVTGKASIFQAAGGNSNTAPVEATGLELVPGATLKVSAKGGVSFSGGRAPSESPDGEVTQMTKHRFSATRGIADVNAPANSLVLVFTGDSLNQNAPKSLDFSGEGVNYKKIAPELQQPIFVGDGRTEEGTHHEVVIPEGAKHLYFGVVDGSQWENNHGSIDVNVTVQQSTSFGSDIDKAFSSDLNSKL